MSAMGELAIDCGEEAQRRYPGISWSNAMKLVTSGCAEAKDIERTILIRKGLSKNVKHATRIRKGLSYDKT